MTQQLASRSTDGECDDGLVETDIHDVLRNDRRRMVLEALGDADGAVSVRELSEELAAREADADPAPRNVRESVYIALHQTHLPKLDGLDVVDYDDTSKTVELGANAAEVGGYMDGCTATAAATYWDATLAGLVVATATSVLVLDPGTRVAVAALSVAVATLCVAHRHHDRRRSLATRLEL